MSEPKAGFSRLKPLTYPEVKLPLHYPMNFGIAGSDRLCYSSWD